MGYMASHGLPMVQLLLPLTILVELGGGLMLVLGWNARLAAGVLFLYHSDHARISQLLGGAGGPDAGPNEQLLEKLGHHGRHDLRRGIRQRTVQPEEVGSRTWANVAINGGAIMNENKKAAPRFLFMNS
jgi:hypothetical protein